jgi:hypothetical protein
MKKKTKIILIVLIAIIILWAILNLIFSFIFAGVYVFHMDNMMEKGVKYMNSISEDDIPVWIERTEKYLKEWHSGNRGIGAYGYEREVPEELKELGIIRIDIDYMHVSYVWLGGMDHTYLDVERLAGGDFVFTAYYNDEDYEVIWPKGDETQSQEN